MPRHAYLTVKKTASMIGVSRATVRRMCQREQIVFVRGPNGERLIDAISVEKYLRDASPAGILLEPTVSPGRAAQIVRQLYAVEGLLLRGILAVYEAPWIETTHEKFDIDGLLKSFERQEEKLEKLWTLLQEVDPDAAEVWRPIVAKANESVEQVRRVLRGVTP